MSIHEATAHFQFYKRNHYKYNHYKPLQANRAYTPLFQWSRAF